MSRPIANPGLAALARAHGLTVRLLALCLRCDQHSINQYASGRKACPRIEARMAEAFGMSVPKLRKYLFTKGGQRLARRVPSRQQRWVRAWRLDAGGEQWFPAGRRYAAAEAVQQTVAAGRQRGCGEVRIRRLPFGFIEAVLWTL